MFLKSILAEARIIVIQTDSAMLIANGVNEMKKKRRMLRFVQGGHESQKLKEMRFSVSSFLRVKGAGAPNENIVQNHLNITLMKVF